ncbi:carbohydrate ABC transporter permease [Murimonas intestini]|uniref:Carbohydrate ABC transporter membrane protein 2 (CUT1 family) n=1 Tax=Murimonas intestini TaxID=1337051 RepID=A0AB73T3Z7_9FIRM|nr:carbohydrate ABC transporter permease [Murimonas intestini]MCR1841033.1 carbohydrate ABC transporter permease [Murimonas intestini]MCR1865849.1 carbohydrate ABC transporter permease [Murimonas intestini]MCR1883269.1 carbohydrate ABC transporter permease [Murimonas intestini]
MKQDRVNFIGKIFLAVLTVIFLWPFFICLLMSVKSKQETSLGILSLPEMIHWENFSAAMEKANILVSMKNSIIITLCSVVIIVLVASTAAYAIGRQYNRKFYRFYETLLVSSMMLPFQVIMIPVYRMYKGMNLLNTRSGAIIMIAGLAIAYSTVMIIGFVRAIPMELEEAAEIEGAGRFRIFFRIIFPLLKPILATVATLQFLGVWNEFNVSILLLQNEAIKTIPMQQYVFFGAYGADYNTAFAAAVITMIPVIIIFLILQKQVVAGMTAGAVKG